MIEVVSPFKDGTTAGRLLGKRGDGGYMIIMQTDDAKKRQQYIELRGLARVITAQEHSDTVFVQYHPKGVKGQSIQSPEAQYAHRRRWYDAGARQPRGNSQQPYAFKIALLTLARMRIRLQDVSSQNETVRPPLARGLYTAAPVWRLRPRSSCTAVGEYIWCGAESRPSGFHQCAAGLRCWSRRVSRWLDLDHGRR